MAAAMILSVGTAAPSLSVSAKESVGNGLILSEDSIVIAEGASATFTAVLAGDADASRLAVVAADPGVVNITPVAYAANAAAYQVTYCRCRLSPGQSRSRGICNGQRLTAGDAASGKIWHKPRQLLFAGKL